MPELFNDKEFRSKIRAIFESEQVYDDLEVAADAIKASVSKIKTAEELENSGDISFDAHQKIEQEASEKIKSDVGNLQSFLNAFDEKESEENETMGGETEEDEEEASEDDIANFGEEGEEPEDADEESEEEEDAEEEIEDEEEI